MSPLRVTQKPFYPWGKRVGFGLHAHIQLLLANFARDDKPFFDRFVALHFFSRVIIIASTVYRLQGSLRACGVVNEAELTRLLKGD